MPPREDPTWGEIVWGQFKKRKTAWFALWGVITLLLIAIYAPVVFSSQPFYWQTSAGTSFPWFLSLYDRNLYPNAVDIFFNLLLFPGTLIALPVMVAWWRAGALPRRPRQQAQRRALSIGVGLWFACLIVVLLFPSQSAVQSYPLLQEQLTKNGEAVSAIYPFFAFSAQDVDVARVLASPSWGHPLGTDSAGRDVLTRLIYGTRISLTVGIFAVALYCTFGTMIGAVAGYFGGRVDMTIQRIIEVVICIPSMFLILTVASFITERSIFHIMLIIAVVSWTGPARLVRAEFLRLRQLDFVAAARASGFGNASIIFEEILPNALGPVLVSATFGVASAILVESTMSFLGLGDPNVSSWGQILNNGRTTEEWTLILSPGAAIFVTVSLLNLVGEGVRDALDPKLRK